MRQRLRRRETGNRIAVESGPGAAVSSLMIIALAFPPFRSWSHHRFPFARWLTTRDHHPTLPLRAAEARPGAKGFPTVLSWNWMESPRQLENVELRTGDEHGSPGYRERAVFVVSRNENLAAAASLQRSAVAAGRRVIRFKWKNVISWLRQSFCPASVSSLGGRGKNPYTLGWPREWNLLWPVPIGHPPPGGRREAQLWGVFTWLSLWRVHCSTGVPGY